MESNVTQEVAAWLSKQPNLPEEKCRVEKLLAKRLNRPGGREVYELRRRVWDEYLTLRPYAREYAREHKYMAELRKKWAQIQSCLNYLCKDNTELYITISEGNITEIKVRSTAAKQSITIGKQDLPLLAMIQLDLSEVGLFSEVENKVLIFRNGDDDNTAVRDVIQAALIEASKVKVVGGSKRARINGVFWQRVQPLYMFLINCNVFKAVIREDGHPKDITDFLAEVFNVPRCSEIKNLKAK